MLCTGLPKDKTLVRISPVLFPGAKPTSLIAWDLPKKRNSAQHMSTKRGNLRRWKSTGAEAASRAVNQKASVRRRPGQPPQQDSNYHHPGEQPITKDVGLNAFLWSFNKIAI